MRYGDLRKITPAITRFEQQDQGNWSKLCEAVPLNKQVRSCACVRVLRACVCCVRVLLLLVRVSVLVGVLVM
jgi:hypothetical protein